MYEHRSLDQLDSGLGVFSSFDWRALHLGGFSSAVFWAAAVPLGPERPDFVKIRARSSAGFRSTTCSCAQGFKTLGTGSVASGLRLSGSQFGAAALLEAKGTTEQHVTWKA